MNRPALISADYQAHTVEVLERLREVFQNRRDQLVIVAHEERKTGCIEAFKRLMADAQLAGVFIDDVAVALQTEQERM